MVNKNRLSAYIPLIVSTLFGLVLFALMEDFVVKVIIQPLLHVTWFVSLIVDSLPQGVLWAGFIIIMLIFTVGGPKKEDKPGLPARATSFKNTGVVESWTKLLENARSSKYSKWRLAQKLKSLTQELLSPSDIGERARNDLSELELPADIRAYFEVKLPSRGSLLERFKRKREGPETALELDPEVVIQHLKKRLNIEF